MSPLLVPYWPARVFHLGPVPIDPWAALVCLGFVVGLEVARARGIRLGLDTRDVVDGALFVVGSGFVGGHLVHVLVYHPELVEQRGWGILWQVWAGLSSFGGFLGAVLGGVAFYRWIRPRDGWLHADTLMFGFPFGWFFGRVGCFVAHDHVGRPSRFPLAVDFPVAGWGGPRHDLGLYEALWTLGIAAVFLVVARRPRRPGTFVALWALLYAPGRFLLDFLRNTDLGGIRTDVRWLGLTPAQYGSVLMFLAGVAVAVHVRRSGRAPVPRPAGEAAASS